MSTDSKSRVEWLDMANVLAMVCVVWFHIPSALEKPVQYTEYIAVCAAFFILSGYSFGLAMHKYGDFRALLCSVARRMLLPTTVFYAVFYFLWLVVGKQLAGDEEEWYEPLLQFVTGNFGLVLSPYWFVVSLAGMQMLFYVLSRSKWPEAVLAFVSSLLPLLTLVVGNVHIYCVSEVLSFFPFFAIGNIASKSAVRGSVQVKSWIGVLFGCCTYFTVTYLAHSPQVYAVSEALCGTSLCLVLSLVSWLICRKVHPGKVVYILRYGALVLLATQNYIIGICRVLLDRIAGELDYLANHMMLKPIVLVLVYLVTMPIILCIKSYLPQVLGKRSVK